MANDNAGSKTEDAINVVEQATEYFVDAAQRMILFSDALRKRGNIYLEHIKAGQPPVLVFKYEVILDAREFDRSLFPSAENARGRRYAFRCERSLRAWKDNTRRPLRRWQSLRAGTPGLRNTSAYAHSVEC